MYPYLYYIIFKFCNFAIWTRGKYYLVSGLSFNCKLYKLLTLEVRKWPWVHGIMILILSLFVSLIIMNNWIVSVSLLLAVTPYITTYLGHLYPIFISVEPHLMIDNLRVSLILLTSWITAIVLVTRTIIIHKNQKSFLFHRLCLFQGLLLTFTFISAFWVVTYLFFEGSLIPTLIMILVWGNNPERLYASMYFLLYTVGASLPIIAAFLWIIGNQDRAPRQWCVYRDIFFSPMAFVGILLILGFLVKLPIYLLHVWLPKAHVEAPVGGSMFLAGVLLKLGPYGVIRIFEIYPFLKWSWRGFIGAWSLGGAIVRALICFRQVDIKSLVAYASVRHMGLTIARICNNTFAGLVGAKIILIGHGLISSALFALVNFYYENTYSRSLFVNRGIIHASPPLTFWWCIAIAANAAIPPSLNFLAEVLMYISLISTRRSAFVPIILVRYSVITLVYRIIIFTGLHHGETSGHLNFICERSIYFSISLLLLGPAYMLVVSGYYLL